MGALHDMYSLCDLPLNVSGTVQKLDCKGCFKRRFLDLGIVENTLITPVLKSPSGDPTAFEIRGTLIALRKEDANLIKVKSLTYDEI